MSATSAAGIPIVKNGSLCITGNSRRVGLVIVIGNNVEIDMRGAGDKSIYGSFLPAENLNVTTNQAEGQGNVKVYWTARRSSLSSQAGRWSHAAKIFCPSSCTHRAPRAFSTNARLNCLSFTGDKLGSPSG